MLREFFCSGPPRRLGVAWGGLLVFLMHALFRARLKYNLNGWYADFYDSLQDLSSENGSGESGSGVHFAKKRREVWDLLVEFWWIVAPALVIHPVGKYLSSVWRFKWRIALTRSYLLHYSVSQPTIEGAAQRIQEDCARFETGVYEAGTLLLDSVLTLLVFTPILVDAGDSARAFGIRFAPWLVCTAFGCAFGGILVSALIGRRLVDLEVTNQVVEAAFRTKLVILEQSPGAVVGYAPDQQWNESTDISEAASVVADHDGARRRPRGDVSPLTAFVSTLADLWDNYHRLFVEFVKMNSWLASYEQCMTILPFLLIAPLVFADAPADRITLGTLMRITNAFDKVFSALAIVSENWAQINEFRSCVRRLREFERRIYTRKRFDRQLLTDEDPLPAEIPVVEISLESAEPTWVSRPV